MEIVQHIILVEKTRLIAIMMGNVRKVTNVELTIAEANLVLKNFMIVALICLKIIALLKILVDLTKEIVILMLRVWKVLPVE